MLRNAITELDRLGSAVGRDARMRELSSLPNASSATMMAVSTSTSTSITKQTVGAWSKVV